MNLMLETEDTGLATTGVFTSDSASYFSIEQPWRDNRPGHSCVPAGVYDLVWYVSPKHGGTYCLKNESLKIMGCDELTDAQIQAGYRSYCELHSANWAEQLEGCIALGLKGQPMFDPITQQVEPAVEDSVNAVTHLLAALGADVVGHTLTIVRHLNG